MEELLVDKVEGDVDVEDVDAEGALRWTRSRYLEKHAAVKDVVGKPRRWILRSADDSLGCDIKCHGCSHTVVSATSAALSVSDLTSLPPPLVRGKCRSALLSSKGSAKPIT